MGYARWAILSALCSGCFFGSIVFVHAHTRQTLKLSEPFFSSPLAVFSEELHVRNDANAKGSFWARRKGGRRHKGVDFLSAVGRPVLASRSGRIVYSGEGKGYGLYVEILHPEGYSTRYAHLSALSVIQGEWVPVGHIIGLSGRTGNADDASIRPHLHYEIRLRGTPLDPARGLLSPHLKINH